MNIANYRWGYLWPVICLLVCPTALSGQTRTNTWFRFTGRYRFSERLTTDLELQHRRQPDGRGGYPLRHAALYSIRPWAYYRISEGVRIDAAPLAYYILYPTLQYPASKPAAPTYEYRSTVGISLRHRIMHRLWIADRTLWEYRNFSHGNDILRGRARLGLQYNLGGGQRSSPKKNSCLTSMAPRLATYSTTVGSAYPCRYRSAAGSMQKLAICM